LEVQDRRHGSEEEWRVERARRILDVASTLILRCGYNKTTIDDIAREAGVGKGTIYLHWKTREALFAALILREKSVMAEDMQQRIADDPLGATLRGLLKHAACALLQRPLLKAVFLRDTAVLGKLMQREQENASTVEVLAGFTSYLQGLREQGLVRTDLSLHTLLTLFSLIFTGFFLATPLTPEAFRPSNEELAELIAEAGHRTLEPQGAIVADACQIAANNLTQYLDHAVARAQEQLYVDVQTERDVAPVEVRPRGRNGGRAKKLQTAESVATARRLYADKERSIEEICSTLGISRATLYRYVREEPEEL